MCGEPESLWGCGAPTPSVWVLAEQPAGHSWGQGSASGAHKQRASRGGSFITWGKLRLCREVVGDGGVRTPGC